MREYVNLKNVSYCIFQRHFLAVMEFFELVFVSLNHLVWFHVTLVFGHTLDLKTCFIIYYLYIQGAA